MNWIEPGRSFSEVDKSAGTYFEDACRSSSYVCSFSSVPQLRALIRERLGGRLSEKEISAVCSETFRNRPDDGRLKESSAGSSVVDFIYQF